MDNRPIGPDILNRVESDYPDLTRRSQDNAEAATALEEIRRLRAEVNGLVVLRDDLLSRLDGRPPEHRDPSR